MTNRKFDDIEITKEVQELLSWFSYKSKKAIQREVTEVAFAALSGNKFEIQRVSEREF